MNSRTRRVLRRLTRDHLSKVAIAIVVLYALMGSFVRSGSLEILGGSATEPVITEAQEIALYSPPSSASWTRWLGTDRQGRSVLVRALHGIDIAMTVGILTGFLAVTIGTILGAVAGYFGRWIDSAIVWLYSTLESIPYLLLLLVLSYSASNMLDDLATHRVGRLLFLVIEADLLPVCIALGATFWTGPCRVVRGEVLKLRESDHVLAARALGAGPWRILFRHVIPNVMHLSLVYFSLSFIGAIKAEVILSFLGFGVKGRPSWGIMIDHARYDLATDFYWQMGAATVFMFGLVLAFNVFTDSLQDALDPKTV